MDLHMVLGQSEDVGGCQLFDFKCKIEITITV